MTGESIHVYVLVQTEVGRSREVADEIAGLSGVTSAEDVTGPYDVIVRATAADGDELGRMVVGRIQKVPGITRTLTCQVVRL